MIHGITFDQQLITAENMSHYMWTFSGKINGITKGCTMSRTTTAITIQAGYILCYGRFTQISGTETIAIPEVTSGTTYYYLVYEIDLSKTNTTSQFLQGTFKLVSSQDTYPTLTQQDLDTNTTTGVYQLPFAKFTVDVNGLDNWSDERVMITVGAVKKVSISLPTASWTGSASPYSQTITVSGSTANTKIDLQPDSTALAQMVDDGTIALYVENNNNVLTVYAVGDKPTADLTMQATMYEVTV